MIIPIDQLPKDVLDGVVEEFITREGTDYGEIEFTLAEKREQILRQLRNGDIVIVYDESTESVNILRKEDIVQ
ncbi:YheU family protein [Sessilibacter corallicola]|uniref:YheU family protein n=1 Tax=Sessilibacter corallicola TaxID=2904075 RepID=UPI001E444198|nr:YheU family protein [Sessilibacter corallicola]MCE2028560.1 YheU family protein [Sessilibacter corallicola]